MWAPNHSLVPHHGSPLLGPRSPLPQQIESPDAHVLLCKPQFPHMYDDNSGGLSFWELQPKEASGTQIWA